MLGWGALACVIVEGKYIRFRAYKEMRVQRNGRLTLRRYLDSFECVVPTPHAAAQPTSSTTAPPYFWQTRATSVATVVLPSSYTASASSAVVERGIGALAALVHCDIHAASHKLPVALRGQILL